jgi:hypothetical protein
MSDFQPDLRRDTEQGVDELTMIYSIELGYPPDRGAPI